MAPGETMMFSAPDASASSGEPLTDIYISVIITLGVVVIGLIIERIIRSRRKD
jgi:hypothetical protein